MDVYVLWHIHRVDDNADEKLIGVYSTREHAVQAWRRLAPQPGFADLPRLVDDPDEGGGGFFLEPYVLDRDHWAEGFTEN